LSIKMYAFFVSSMRTACIFHTILLHLITIIVFYEECKLSEPVCKVDDRHCGNRTF
jgi:hypothetical protein